MLYPMNTNVPRYAQTDARSVRNRLLSVVRYSAGSPGLADADWYVTSVAMGNKTYTLAKSAPDAGARNVTCTRTVVDTADTPGKITVTGKDLAGEVITEELTPGANGVLVVGTKAFASVTSVVGSGWTQGGTGDAEDEADTIVVGFGDLLGLPDKLDDTAVVLAASLNGAREATMPTITKSDSVLALNTMDLASNYDGTAVALYYLA